MPAARAISSVEAPWSPFSANSSVRRLEHGRRGARRRSGEWWSSSSVVSIHSQRRLSRPACERASADERRERPATRSTRPRHRRRERQRERAREGGVGAGERPLVAVGARAGGARTSRSAPRSPRPAARRAPRRGGRAGRRRPASRAGRPRRRTGVSTRCPSRSVVPAGDALPRGEQLLEAASCGIPIAQRMSGSR